MNKAFVYLMVALLAGCSSSSKSTNPQSASPRSARPRVSRLATAARTVAKDQSSRLEAPSQPLSAFSDFELKPMELSVEVADRKEKVEAAKRLEDRLHARLLPLIELWKVEGNSLRTGGGLLIQPKLWSLRVNSPRARFWRAAAGGPIAHGGGSVIVMDLELTDGRTGTVIANPRIIKVTGPNRTRGATDQNLLDYIAETAYQYLADNYKK